MGGAYIQLRNATHTCKKMDRTLSTIQHIIQRSRVYFPLQIAFWSGKYVMGILLGGVYVLSKLVTAQVVTALLILIGFVVLRFIVRTVLQITFTLLRYLFWIVVLAVILLCVL